jgi:hypothetical protein
MSSNKQKKPNNDEEVYGLKKVVDTSWERLLTQSAEGVVNRTLCILGESSKTYILNFMGEDYLIKPEQKMIETQSGEPFYNLFKIGIMLHYMVQAKEKSLANKFIGFRELWGGNEYYYAFNNRVLKPLVDTFGDKPEQFIQAAEAIGSEKIEKGEYGFKIPGLPRVPIYVLLWTGDEEVEPSVNVLFDATANQHMETEALVWLAVAMISELKKHIK